MANIPDITDLLIQKGLPFAIYCLSDSRKCTLIFQKDQISSQVDIIDIESVSGFVIADFNSARTRMVNLIVPDFVLSDGDNIDDAVNYLNSLPDSGGFDFSENICISKPEYLNRATFLVDKLKEKKLQKVVLSRVINKKLKGKLSTGEFIRTLTKKYKEAFVYLFHLPNNGTWCGATPETLIKIIGDGVHIDALAGTRLMSGNEKTPDWSLKEKEEQHYVTIFIKSLLSELGITDYEESVPSSITAGNLAHICTKFKIPLNAVSDKIGKLLAGLHPTPAVCGLPKADAFLLIDKAEQHQRRFYTGFLGPWNLKGGNTYKKRKSQLFVNLRCAELDSDKINIYVGGGLTASSDPEAEYQETVHKSQTLLSIVEKL